MDLKVNNTSVKNVIYNGNVVKRVDVNRNGETTPIYKKQVDLLINGIATAISGGFTHTRQRYSSQWTLNYNGEGCAYYVNSNSGAVSRVDTNNIIDWSNYTKLCIDLAGRDNDTYNTLYVVVAKGSPSTGIRLPNSDPNVTQKQTSIPFNSITTRQTIEIDVSSITESGKLLLGINGLSPWVKIYNIWVE